MGKKASHSSRLRRLAGLVLAFFALLATTIIMPTLNTPSLTAYAATRTQTMANVTSMTGTTQPTVTASIQPPTLTTTLTMTLTTTLSPTPSIQPPTPTPTLTPSPTTPPPTFTPALSPTPTPSPTTPPPAYQLGVTPNPLLQNNGSCAANTSSNYSCFATLSISPVPLITDTVTWSDSNGDGGTVSGGSFPANIQVNNLPCPSATQAITFNATIVENGVTIQATATSDSWSCNVPPTATPSPTPTTPPTPTPTNTPSPTPGTTPSATPSATPGTTPGTTPTPTATSGSVQPTAIPTVCPTPGNTSSCSPTTHSTPTSPTKTTQGTQGTQGASPTASPTATQGGAVTDNSGGKNDPPSSGKSGPLFLIASLVLAALAVLLYLLTWGQGAISERLLSLVLPASVVRRLLNL